MNPWYLLVWLKQVILLSEVSPVLFKGENANNIWPIQRDVLDCHYLLTLASRPPSILPFLQAISRKQSLGGSSSCVDLQSRKRMHQALQAFHVSLIIILVYKKKKKEIK